MMALENNAPDPTRTVRPAWPSVVDLGALLLDASALLLDWAVRVGFLAVALWRRGCRRRGFCFSLFRSGLRAAFSGSTKVDEEICTGGCSQRLLDGLQGWAFLDCADQRSSVEAVLTVVLMLVLMDPVVGEGGRRKRPALGDPGELSPADAGADLPILPRPWSLFIAEGVYPTHWCVFLRRRFHQRIDLRRCFGKLRAASPVVESCVSCLDLGVIFFSLRALLLSWGFAVIVLAVSGDFQ